MVILKWLNTILTGNRTDLTQAATGHSSENVKKGEKNKTVDLINETIVNHAEDLSDLINVGSAIMKRKKLKNKIRKKVEEVLADELSDPNIVEEVTERITDAAEIDPYYKNMFDRDNA